MSNGITALVALVCVLAGVAALLLIAGTDPAERPVESPPTDDPSSAPRIVVRETEVPESERTPDGPVRTHTLWYVHGSASKVVVRNDVYNPEVDFWVRESGRREFELFDSLLSPDRGVVLWQQNLSVYAGVFDPRDARRARVCRPTMCGSWNEIESARIVDDADGLRVEIARERGGSAEVYDLVLGPDRLECRKRPATD